MDRCDVLVVGGGPGGSSCARAIRRGWPGLDVLVLDRARETGRIDDPVVRQEVAKLLILSRTAEWTARRARAAQALGRPQGPEGSLGKLASSHVARLASQVHTLISGADAMLAGEDGPHGGIIAEVLISVPATSIAGGSGGAAAPAGKIGADGRFA